MPKPTRNLLQQPQPQPWPPLRCPRCNSTNTKFCYYNNYRKTQPRYLCKACRRHWTEGGTLRDVPVGGGRKNKRIKPATTNQISTAAPSTSNVNSPGSNIFPEILCHVLLQPNQQVFSLPFQAPAPQAVLPYFGMMSSLVGPREIVSNNLGSYTNGLNNYSSTSGYTQTRTGGDISMVSTQMQLDTGNWSTWDDDISGLANPDVKPPNDEGCWILLK